MKVLFLTLIDFDNIEERNIYTDLLRKFYQEGHAVYAISPVERKKGKQTRYIRTDKEIHIIKLKIGNIQKTNVIEKGISTIMLESVFIDAIKKYYSDVKFDLVLYSTPPITLQKAVKFVKRRDNAVTYLMLKDIFPQNAVDIGMLSKHGIKGILYKYFRRKEIKLYQESDYIGCMSMANVKYVIKHNPYIKLNKIEICPNCIEPTNRIIDKKQRSKLREKLGVPSERILFVYGGNLGRPQGIPFLIECLKKLKKNKKVFFLIIGDGTEYKSLNDFVKKEKPNNVKLMQILPKDEYENIILAADVGMIFLDSRFKIPNFPSRLLSYMDAGIPVLSVTDENTDIGDVIEKGKFGWKCLSENSGDVVKKIAEIANMDNINAYGKNARKYLKEYYSTDCAYNVISKHIC